MTQTIKSFFKRLVEDYHSHVKYHATIKELNALTDKELNDIGISRGEIISIARCDSEMKVKADAPFNPNMRGFV